MSLRILLAVDGSAGAMSAVKHVLKLRELLGTLEVHLLSVQVPVESGHVRWFISHEQLESYYREEGLAALQQAKAALDAVGQPYTAHIAVGHTATTIARYAGEVGAHQVVMGSHGRSGLGRALLGSVISEVIRLSPVPVTVVGREPPAPVEA
ncbi:universal stress protein [Vogesella oryzae]|uniref:universal stress protein n=1 Tax=Vogesella oryzae TaxID=1735285 RepID=UPI0015834D1E|nr:universal stress protein [Vogesella oryzae]